MVFISLLHCPTPFVGPLPSIVPRRRSFRGITTLAKIGARRREGFGLSPLRKERMSVEARYDFASSYPRHTVEKHKLGSQSTLGSFGDAFKPLEFNAAWRHVQKVDVAGRVVHKFDEIFGRFAVSSAVCWFLTRQGRQGAVRRGAFVGDNRGECGVFLTASRIEGAAAEFFKVLRETASLCDFR